MIGNIRRLTFPSLGSEELEKLQKFRPQTLYQASCLEGISPHTMTILYKTVCRLKSEERCEQTRKSSVP